MTSAARSALQWAIRQKKLEIVRLLLSYGACSSQVSAWGWSPVFFLWPAPSKETQLMASYLRVLGSDVSIEWEGFDIWGWTVLDRAAAFGAGQEVEALIQHGAKPSTPALPLRWTALHHAIFYGNMETFLVLIDKKHHPCIDSTDARGWTLLHIAASAGQNPIVRQLLSIGADHRVLSSPYPTHMPEVLLNRSFSPSMAALAQSAERYQRYMQALADFRLKEDPVEDSDDEDAVFSDAQEKVCAASR